MEFRVSLLEVVDLRKSFEGHRAVDGLSFDIRPGEVLGLLGPNGAGKTTTMSIIAGLLAQDSGELKFRDQVVSPRADVFRRALGVVPQDLAIYPDLSARENLTFFGRLYGVTGTTLQERIARLLDRIGLTEQADRPSRTFSGGMKRRLNFAVSLLHQPALVMLDEPTVGVDPQSRAHLLDCVRELRQQGVSVLYASHYMEEVEAVCDRVAIIDHGRLMACGTLEELLAQVHLTVKIGVTRLTDDCRAALRTLPFVSELEVPQNGTAETQLLVRTNVVSSQPDAAGEVLNETLRVLTARHIGVSSVTTQGANLEHLFLELTGRLLRD